MVGSVCRQAVSGRRGKGITVSLHILPAFTLGPEEGFAVLSLTHTGKAL